MPSLSFRAWRRLAYILQAAVMLGLPFLTIGGESALRFDIPNLRLHLFGASFFIQEFFLLLLALLALVFLFVFFTALLGRIWCGWMCPQSAIIEIQHFLKKGLAVLGLRGQWATFSFQLLAFVFSLVISGSLVCWFLTPPDLIRLLKAGGDAPGGFITRLFLVSMAATIYAETVLLGRTFCKTVCPYARLQGALFDDRTLAIGFDEARREECTGCDLCVRECPVGIDIKKGLQAECIACAECIDACRRMTSRRGVFPIVRYAFGQGQGTRFQLYLTGMISLLFIILFVIGMAHGKNVEMTVSRPPGPLYRIGREGEVINLYRVSVQNRKNIPAELSISIAGVESFRLLTPDRLRLSPGELKTLSVAVEAASGAAAHASEITFVLSDGGGEIMRKKSVFLRP